MLITGKTTVEEIIEIKPQSVTFLAEKGIRCIVCGEAIWGTIADIAESKGWTNKDIDILIKELNSL